MTGTPLAFRYSTDAWPAIGALLWTKATTPSCSTSRWVSDWLRAGSPPSSATVYDSLWQLRPTRALTDATQACAAWGPVRMKAPTTPDCSPTVAFSTAGSLRVQAVPPSPGAAVVAPVGPAAA